MVRRYPKMIYGFDENKHKVTFFPVVPINFEAEELRNVLVQANEVDATNSNQIGIVGAYYEDWKGNFTNFNPQWELHTSQPYGVTITNVDTSKQRLIVFATRLYDNE